jgi:hypothetical protein
MGENTRWNVCKSRESRECGNLPQVRYPRGKGRGSERLTSTSTSKNSDLQEVYLYLTSKNFEVYL